MKTATLAGFRNVYIDAKYLQKKQEELGNNGE